MDFISIAIQFIFFAFASLVFLDVFRDLGFEEFVVEQFNEWYLGDCTPVQYFQFSLKDLED